MKSMILYGSFQKLTKSHKLVTGQFQTKFYVRVKVVSGDCGSAFAKVKCMRGENLLNTQDILEPLPPNPLRQRKPSREAPTRKFSDEPNLLSTV